MTAPSIPAYLRGLSKQGMMPDPLREYIIKYILPTFSEHVPKRKWIALAHYLKENEGILVDRTTLRSQLESYTVT